MRIDAIRTRNVLSRQLSRRTLLAGAGMTSLAAVLSACGGDEEVEGGSGTTTLTWWHIQDFDPLLSRWEEVVNEFHEEHANIRLDVTPLNNDVFKSELTTAMQGDEPPDMFQSWGGGVLAQFAEAGLVQDITDGVEPILGNFHEHALAPYTIDDRIYGLPFNMGMVGIWYNQTLFEQAGITEPPTTWNQFLEVVQQLKAANITPIALGGEPLWPGHYWWTYLAMRVAGVEGLQAAAEERSLEAPEFVQAGELLQELTALEPFQPGFLSASYDQEDGQAALVGTGQAAMELMGHWAPNVQVDASGTEGLGEALGFFPFPEVEGGAGAVTEVLGGGDGIAVGRDAEEGVFEFLNFMFEVERYRGTVETGAPLSVMPETDDAVEDPRLHLVLEQLGQQTAFQLYVDQDFPPAVGQEINASTGALIAGEKDPEAVVRDVTAVWQREQ
jgi:raffinose/stachyose/melibiose transport system substrate-binding protein